MQKKRVSLPHFILPILMLLSAVLAQPAQGVEYWGSIGTGVGRPAASRNNDGRLEVFVRRADGALWHRWTDPNAPDGWSAWQTLGGPITGDPIVARAADGRLEVFALNSGALVHKWRSGASPESSWSASWTQIAANIASDPAMILNSAGVLQVFARATDASIGYSVQQSALPGAAWTSWASLGGFVSGVPAAAVNADGRAEVFARTPDGIIWHKWETAAGGPWSAWWFNLDGTVASHPVVGRNSDGRLEVFAITNSGLLWHRRQSTAGATTDWTAGATLGGDVLGRVAGTTGNLTGTPALAIGDGGRLGVIARSTDGRWWSKWQKAASSDIWSVWTSLCGISASEPVVAPPQNGDPHLVLRASDGVLWQKKCDKACRGNRGKSVPVLIYHAFSEANPSWGIPDLFVKPSEFQKQLHYLDNNGFTTVQFEDLDNLCVVEKPVVITVDDGYDNNYTDMYPLLQTAAADAVVFSFTNAIGATHYLTEAQMLAMRDRVSFQNHTANHAHLDQLTAEQARSEMTQATDRLQPLTGQTVLALAYPYGGYNETVRSLARESFRYAVATTDGVYRLGEDRYTIPRVYVGRTYDLNTFIQNLRTCAHSEYTTGVPLASNCGGGCAATVCASHPSCCQFSWDSACVAAAETECDVDTP